MKNSVVFCLKCVASTARCWRRFAKDIGTLAATRVPLAEKSWCWTVPCLCSSFSKSPYKQCDVKQAELACTALSSVRLHSKTKRCVTIQISGSLYRTLPPSFAWDSGYINMWHGRDTYTYFPSWSTCQRMWCCWLLSLHFSSLKYNLLQCWSVYICDS